MKTPLYVNQVVRDAAERNLRILSLLSDDDQIAMIDLGPGRTMPFWMPRSEVDEQILAGTMTFPLDDPMAASIRLDSDLSPTEIAIRDRRHAYILPLLDDPEQAILSGDYRHDAVKAHVVTHGGSKESVYTYLKLWWCRGQLPNALVPAYSASAATRRAPGPDAKKLGRRRYNVDENGLAGTNVTPEILAGITAGRTFLNEGKSVTKAYDATLLKFFADHPIVNGQRTNVVWDDSRIPSLDQFIYHLVRKIGRGDVLLSVKGETRFARKSRPRTGTAKDRASGPGAIYQIDATIADIFLRSHKYRDRLIGRPVLYIVIDVYSRMIVGFAVALSGPSWEIVKLALENAMMDKVAYCASLGRTITEDQWPCHHVCQELVIDRGSDVKGTNGAAAAKGLGYRRARLPPYRPDWKGLVESRFNLIHEGEIKWVPGATHGRERGEPKHILDAEFTIATFTELMLNCILNYNSSFQIENPPSDYVSADARPPTPLDLWKFGCQANAAPQEIDHWRVRANLLHVGKARETDRGLLFSGLHYQSADPERARMFRRVPGRHWGSHEIRFDPRDMASILLPVNRGASFEVFRLTPADREFDGWTQDEVRDQRAAAREGRRLAVSDQFLAKSKHAANQADLLRRVLAETDGIPLTPKSAIGMRDARAAERRDIQREGAWTSVAPPPEMPVMIEGPEPAIKHPEAPPDVPAPDATGQTDRMKRLLAAREASLKKSEESQ
jgi:putative transposase